jgi:lysylphosphatidylglycerol synthetase-like protein (DUF2156 family)
VLELLRRHGWNATSFQVLEEGFTYAFPDTADACVAYVDTGQAWVVAGAPIAAPAAFASVTDWFAARARRARRRLAFFAVEERFTRATTLQSIRVGEQPTWDPSTWEATLSGARAKSLREQLRRARAKGVVARSVSPAELAPGSATRRAVESVIAGWLASRAMAPMGFLVDVQPFAFADERRYMVAEQDGRVVAFLAAVPVFARGGWFIEDLVRRPDAPNGTAELLVDATMRALAREGSHYVTLGLAPLAGSVTGWLRVAREQTRALYDFEGLRTFKAKLRPGAWEPIHLAYMPDALSAVALFDVLTAFARGSVTRFGVETLLRALGPNEGPSHRR